jgi:hypothetical protein
MGTSLIDAFVGDPRPPSARAQRSVLHDFHPDAPSCSRRPGPASWSATGGASSITVDKYDVVVMIRRPGGARLEPPVLARVLPVHSGRTWSGGIVKAWIPGGELKVVAALLASGAFPCVRVFVRRGLGRPPASDARPIANRTGRRWRRYPAARQDLVEWGLIDFAEQFDANLRDEDLSWAALRLRPALTDDRPVNAYFLVRRALR